MKPQYVMFPHPNRSPAFLLSINIFSTRQIMSPGWTQIFPRAHRLNNSDSLGWFIVFWYKLRWKFLTGTRLFIDRATLRQLNMNTHFKGWWVRRWKGKSVHLFQDQIHWQCFGNFVLHCCSHDLIQRYLKDGVTILTEQPGCSKTTQNLKTNCQKKFCSHLCVNH